jgi:hypothetical protein
MQHESLFAHIAFNSLNFALGSQPSGGQAIVSLPQLRQLLFLGPRHHLQQQLWSMLFQLAWRSDADHFRMTFLDDHSETSAIFQHAPHRMAISSFPQIFAEQRLKGCRQRPFILVIAENLDQMQTKHQEMLSPIFSEGGKWAVGMVATASTSHLSEVVLANTPTQIILHESMPDLASEPDLAARLSTPLPDGIHHPLLLYSEGKTAWLSSLRLSHLEEGSISFTQAEQTDE